jgi:hypothetical protein
VVLLVLPIAGGQYENQTLMNTLAYKVNSDEVMQRLRSLYGRAAQDQIFASFEIPSTALRRFAQDYPDSFCNYPDPGVRIRFWNELLKERSSLNDDSLPSAYLSEFDQGLYGGLLGGNVRFMAHPENGWISSMVPPLLRDWHELDSLSFEESTPWWRLYQHQLDVFTEGAASRFGISHFILINGLNFAFELVGASKTYLSLYENPDDVRKAIDLAFQLNVTVQEAFFERTPCYEGGTFSNMVQWIEGRIVSESVDPFHMTSVDCFEQWGRGPVQRMFDHFDGGVLHLHGNGRHLLEPVCSIQGLKAVQLGDDRGFPSAIEVLPEMRSRAGELPLVVQAEYGAFLEKLNKHELPGGIFYKVQDAPDRDSANRMMDTIRSYRT